MALILTPQRITLKVLPPFFDSTLLCFLCQHPVLRYLQALELFMH